MLGIQRFNLEIIQKIHLGGVGLGAKDAYKMEIFTKKHSELFVSGYMLSVGCNLIWILHLRHILFAIKSHRCHFAWTCFTKILNTIFIHTKKAESTIPVYTNFLRQTIIFFFLFLVEIISSGPPVAVVVKLFRQVGNQL